MLVYSDPKDLTVYRGTFIPVIPGIFRISYVRNPGAAWGMLATMNEKYRVPFFITISIVAILAIFLYYVWIHPSQRLTTYALAFILSGAIGNFIDRIHYGYVVDFLDFFVINFPAFN